MSDTQASTVPTNWDHAMYALEKLSDSVQLLVAGEGDARSRVMAASRYFFRVIPEWLPASGDMRAGFRRAIGLLAKYKPPGSNDELPGRLRDTDFTYTMRKIRNSTASHAASELFGVWLELSNVYHEHIRLKWEDAQLNPPDVAIIDELL